MFGVATSDDYQPVAWMGRYPIHITTLLVMIHVVCMIIGCLLIAVGAGSFLGVLTFDSAQVLYGGRLWQIATYALVHSPSALIWFAIEMYMLFAFGREVERFIGRRAFIALYLLLLLVPPLLLTVWGLWQRTGLAGSATIHFAIYIAFLAVESALPDTGAGFEVRLRVKASTESNGRCQMISAPPAENGHFATLRVQNSTAESCHSRLSFQERQGLLHEGLMLLSLPI
jgi:hypothetical protein